MYLVCIVDDRYHLWTVYAKHIRVSFVVGLYIILLYIFLPVIKLG